jgi:murein tripeptide amidase MpaA
MKISSNFDGGNIRVISDQAANDIRLEIKPDHGAKFFQWFYFRLSGARQKQCLIKIVNAGEASYVNGWEGYRAVASYDRDYWFRVDTYYEDGELCIQHQPAYDSIYYAYFAPYSMDKHASLVSIAQTSPRARLINLGETLDGQDIDLIKIGEDGDDKKVGWAIARQHPGETMAEWWMEGFLSRLLDSSDAVPREVLAKMVIYVVPNMNPDGSVRGHLRTNAAGANLNREWLEPTMEKSPEVFLVREMMHKTGVDFCLDVHGDEGLPYNFIASSEGVPSWTEAREELLNKFKQELMLINPDFQMEHGYPKGKPGQANMTMCSNYVGETFGCPAMTLEMPFKDTVDTPHALQGWSPERSEHLGAANVEAIYRVLQWL